MPVPSTAMVEPGPGQAAAMRRGVDAERETGNDGQAGFAQRACERLGICAALCVALRLPTMARRGTRQQLDAATSVEQRRWIRDLEQEPG